MLRESLFTKLSLPINMEMRLNTGFVPTKGVDPLGGDSELSPFATLDFTIRDPDIPIPDPPNATIPGAVPTTQVLLDGLHALDEMKNNSWIDNQTLAVLLSLAQVDPYDKKVTTVTIIFENLQMYGRATAAAPLQSLWMTSFTTHVINLRTEENILPLNILFLIVHVIVLVIELDLSVATLILDKKGPLTAIWRALSLTTLINVAILVIHIIYLEKTSIISPLKQQQLEKIIMLLENNFEGEVPEKIKYVV